MCYGGKKPQMAKFRLLNTVALHLMQEGLYHLKKMIIDAQPAPSSS
jgi:hypothetical protein